MTKSLVEQRFVNCSEELATTKDALRNREETILNQQRMLAVAGTDKEAEELRARVRKFDELRDALTGPEDELWKLRGQQPTAADAERLRRSKLRVLTIANLKGGVGKTTLTINLAAHYALAHKMRVLVIDFDYQGSATATFLNALKQGLGSNILADALLGGEVGGRWVADVPRDLGAILPGARLVTCGPTFDRFENQTMIRWLIGDIEDDARFRLVNLLMSPEVQSAYDLVLIDAPPRMSLGAINGFCASHAVIVPFVPDALSADPLGRFFLRLTKIRNVTPALETVLAVPSLAQGATLKDEEEQSVRDARTALANWGGAAYVTENHIRHMPTLAKVAGREVAYVKDTRWVRPAFAALGDEIKSRLGF